jgi:hypothetical protein
MAQNSAGSDDQVVDKGGNRVDMRRANEDAKGVVIDRDGLLGLHALRSPRQSG